MDFKKEVVKLLSKYIKVRDLEDYIEIPPDNNLGDYAFPCFVLSKELKKNPNEIAENLAEKIKLNKYFLRVENRGPYLNFFVNKEILTKEVLSRILKENKKYGSSNLGKGQKVLVEHTSINPNASPHVGRARNALIGDSLTRLFRFQNYKPEVHYFINDVGKQIAVLVLGCRKLKKLTFDSLLKVYIESYKKLDKSKDFEKEVFNLLYKLEKGDKKTINEFKRVVGICVKGQNKILNELGIKYDKFDYESKYLWSKQTDLILERLKKTKKLFRDDSERWVLDQRDYNLPMKESVFVLTRADGTSLYGLRDIAYNIEKLKRAKKNIVVLGEDQKLYFLQIKAVLGLLNYKAPDVIHYSFVLLQEGKMSTRQGNVVLLEDFMKEAKNKANKELVKRYKKGNEKLAKIIGYGALKYAVLKISPEKNVLFEWDKALNFEGDSAPYIQYSHARICSILKKSKTRIKGNIKVNLLDNKEEIKLINLLSLFPEILIKTITNYKPNIISNYLFELSQAFNEFYHNCPILKERKDLREARLLLISCVKQVLENGLNLLGIEAPEKM